MEKLQANYDNIHINILCSSDGNDHSLVQLLKELSPLEYVLNGYVCLAQTYPSDIFKLVWQNKVDLHAGDTLSLTDIQTKLWNPVIEQCIDLLTALQKCTIKLSVVDEYFCQPCPKEKAALTGLMNLCHGLKKCKAPFEGSEKEIQEGFDFVKQYWSLCTYSNPAKICLKLKERLELEGDFKMVEALAKQVSSLLIKYLWKYDCDNFCRSCKKTLCALTNY